MNLLTEERQAAIAHDLPVVSDLIEHHAIFLAVRAKESQQIKLKNIAWRAELIYRELKTLEKQMQSLGKKEYPGAAWLSNYDRSAEKKDGE